MKLNTINPNNYGSGNYTVGHQFTAAAVGYVTEFWASVVFGSGLPNKIVIRNLTDGINLATVQPLDTDWQVVDANTRKLDVVALTGDAITVPTGKTLAVAYYRTGGWQWTFRNGFTPTPDAGLTWLGSYSGSGDNPSMGDSGSNTWAYDLTVATTDPVPDLPPATDPNNAATPATPNDIAQWLQWGNAQLRGDSLAKLIRDDLDNYLPQLLAAVKAGDDTALTQSSLIAGRVGSSGNAASAVGTTLFALLKFLVANSGSIVTAVTRLEAWLHPNEAEPDGILLDLLRYIQEFLGLEYVRRSESLGSGAWTLVDEAPLVGGIAWPVEADRYVLSIETVGEDRVANVWSGVTTYHRLGWWAELDGDLVGERHYCEFTRNVLLIPGVRMRGVLVTIFPEAAATIQAWKRDPVPPA